MKIKKRFYIKIINTNNETYFYCRKKGFSQKVRKSCLYEALHVMTPEIPEIMDIIRYYGFSLKNIQLITCNKKVSYEEIDCAEFLEQD